MIRGLFAVSLTLCLFACSNDSPSTPSTPSTPSPTPTRIIAVSGNLAFGEVEVGSVRDVSFSIANTGNAPLTVTGVTAPARYRPSWTSGQIPAGSSQNVTLRFDPWTPMSYDGTLTISADQTSGTNTLSVSGTGTRPPGRGVFGIMTDATGDAVPYPELASADLAGASIDVNAGALTLTVAFVPGTLSTNVIRCLVLLDTDENAATGQAPSGEAGNGLLGSDYLIVVVDSLNSGRGVLARWDGQAFRQVATAAVAFTGTEARIAFPMSLLGNDDGWLTYKIQAAHWSAATGSSIILDRMTEVGAGPGLTR